MTKLDEILQQVRLELGADFVSSDVVGVDGIPIASIVSANNIDTNDAAARYAMVMKLAAKISDKLGIGTVVDNMATTDKVIILGRFLGDGSYFWRLSVAKDATLGVVRMVMNEQTGPLWDAIPR